MAPRKTPPSKGKAKKSAPSKKKAPAKKKTAAKKKAPAKKRASSRKKATSKAAAAPPPSRDSWRRFFVKEALTVAAGMAIGLGVTSTVLWQRARQDVRAYLAEPPRPLPGVIYSAPVTVRAKQPLTPADLAGDLLAAGYERVEQLSAPGQFTVSGERIDAWTAALDSGPLHLPEGKQSVVFRDGRAASTTPSAGATFRPTTLAVIGDLEERRDQLDLSALAPTVEPAVLAMEDTRFRDHHGVDPLGIARAVFHNLTGSGGLHGGSTLTQQLAKNLFLTSERTLQRKVREAFFAAALEAELSKDELLALYLSEVYLGQVGGVPIYGVEKAARAWFGVSAENLTLSQSATIAGVIAAPNRWSPVRHPERALERRNVVLDRMVAAGLAQSDAAEEAKRTPITLQGELPGAVRRAPWAVDIAVDKVEQTLGEGALATRGYAVHTTIDPVLQRIAQDAIREGLRELASGKGTSDGAQAALVALRVSDGSVAAVVGGSDYTESPFNRAVNAWRQVGSTVKPLTALAYFDGHADASPIDTITDEPITRLVDGKSWTPKNGDGQFIGEITLREAIEKSRNIPAVKLAEEVGFSPLQGFLRESGLSRATHLPSASLGAFESTPWEMARAYSAFPAGGALREPYLVSRVQSPDGNLIDLVPEAPSPLASARAAAVTTSILEGVLRDGTGWRSASWGVRGPAGGKTGTTQDTVDAWFVGFTPELVVAVWVGHDKNQPLGLGGSSAALPIWSRFIVDSGAQRGRFPTPDSIELAAVCSDSHQVARDACPITYQEAFSRGEVPRRQCDEHGSPVVEVGRTIRDLFRFGKKDEPGNGAEATVPSEEPAP